MHVLVYYFKFWDEIILREEGEEYKARENFKFRFFGKNGKMVIYRNSP